ncbi:tetratricopeptide repeat protein [Polynucleobacter asymbioticus]|nr:tetratricopeptide repeat protein [Polynucleobacter asymbioticus]
MNPQLQLMLQQAIEAFQGGNFERAATILQRLIQVDPKNLPALHILGLIRASQANFKEAAHLLGRAARIHPNDASIQYNLAKALSDIGSDNESIPHHKKAVELAPHNPEAWLNYGKTESNLGRHENALIHYDKALSLEPHFVQALSNKSATLRELRRFEDALACAEKALAISPDLAEAWSNKGIALKGLKRYDDAIVCYDKALSIRPDDSEVMTNKGATLYELGQYDEAIIAYDQAISLKPDYHEAWTNKGVAFNKLGRYDEAIVSYDHALKLMPEYPEAWVNKGATLYELKRYDQAIAHYDKAVSLKPDYHEAWSNRGLVFHQLRKFDEVVTCYDQALKIKPDYAEGWGNKGATLHELKRFEEAIACYDKAVNLDPDIQWFYGALVHLKSRICSWGNIQEEVKTLIQKVSASKKMIQPFAMLSLTGDPFLHKKSSEIYTQFRFSRNSILGPIPKQARKERIRIAYFSGDFRNHAVALLTSELYEIHDRSRFEVFAFSLLSSPDGDELNARLRTGFDHFIDVENLSDQEIAQMARKLGIDIAIDLGGHTQYSRTGIFSYRAAPIQVNWLGYPGTLGADYIDYIIADYTLIPKESQQFYSEKVVTLPDTYMVDDSKRISSGRIFSKLECGLPEDSFIFCCFNNDYKFNEQVLDSWSRIMLRVNNSVLWISENNPLFKKNISAEFEKRGIDSSRIIFAQRVELMADHLARYSLADLFLDTYPYNAHTTTVDALKAGVPVLTLIGQSFPGRVAASLLNAIGLPELVTTTQQEYEELAIQLASNPQKLLDIKNKLAVNRLSAPLFDTPLFAKNLEAAYIKMYERYQADLEPEHLAIQ